MERSSDRFMLMPFIIIVVVVSLATLSAAQDKPNILVIWGDDIGISNISHNNDGMVGYMTPNIDRIAKEGISFTD